MTVHGLRKLFTQSSARFYLGKRKRDFDAAEGSANKLQKTGPDKDHDNDEEMTSVDGTSQKIR